MAAFFFAPDGPLQSLDKCPFPSYFTVRILME